MTENMGDAQKQYAVDFMQKVASFGVTLRLPLLPFGSGASFGVVTIERQHATGNARPDM